MSTLPRRCLRGDTSPPLQAAAPVLRLPGALLFVVLFLLQFPGHQSLAPQTPTAVECTPSVPLASPSIAGPVDSMCASGGKICVLGGVAEYNGRPDIDPVSATAVAKDALSSMECYSTDWMTLPTAALKNQAEASVATFKEGICVASGATSLPFPWPMTPDMSSFTDQAFGTMGCLNHGGNTGWVAQAELLNAGPARVNAGMAQLDNELCIVGGWKPDSTGVADLPNPAGIVHSTVECFSVSSGIGNWQMKSASMTSQRFGHGVVNWGGRLCAVGGQSVVKHFSSILDTAECYSNTNNQWQVLPSQLSQPLVDLAVVAGIGGDNDLTGTMCAVGGAYSHAATGALTATDGFECFDGQSWVVLADMLTARVGLAAAVNGDKLFACGGHDPGSKVVYSTVEIYDPDTKVWSQVPGMNGPRTGLGAVLYHAPTISYESGAAGTLTKTRGGVYADDKLFTVPSYDTKIHRFPKSLTGTTVATTELVSSVDRGPNQCIDRYSGGVAVTDTASAEWVVMVPYSAHRISIMFAETHTIVKEIDVSDYSTVAAQRYMGGVLAEAYSATGTTTDRVVVFCPYKESHVGILTLSSTAAPANIWTFSTAKCRHAARR